MAEELVAGYVFPSVFRPKNRKTCGRRDILICAISGLHGGCLHPRWLPLMPIRPRLKLFAEG
jgi:hypothetical protein